MAAARARGTVGGRRAGCASSSLLARRTCARRSACRPAALPGRARTLPDGARPRTHRAARPRDRPARDLRARARRRPHAAARVVASPGAATHTSHAPFTGGPIAAVPLSTPDDVARAADPRALGAAAVGRPPAARAHRGALPLHDLVLERQSDVLDLIQLETGKARVSAFEEVCDIAHVARHYALGPAATSRRVGCPGIMPGLTRARVLRHPVGVVGIIAPWNFPLTLTLGDVLPALVAGNAVILRPGPADGAHVAVGRRAARGGRAARRGAAGRRRGRRRSVRRSSSTWTT